MKSTWKIMVLVLAIVFACGTLFACAPAPAASSTPAPASEKPSEAAVEPSEEPSAEVSVVPGGELPRNETIYMAGFQYGAIKGWNPYSADMNNAIAVTEEPARQVVNETLYMYNLLDGKMYPLLADGDYEWNADQTEMTVKINPDAKWSDGTPVTAEDVAYTYECHLKYETNRGLEFKDFIEKIEAVDASTVKIYSKLDKQGKPVNPLQVVRYLGKTFVNQKAFTQKLEERAGGDASKFKNDPCEDFVASGPYKSFYADDQKVVYIRDDNYWGQAASMWGKLPVPKYICHVIYEGNEASQAAFEAGQVDVNQQFLPDIQKLWLEKGLPISTYIDEPPYGICTAIPTAWYNMKSYGLDQVAVRKAIALAVDYDAIIANAMTNQSPSFKDVPRSCMNPTDGEQAAFDHDAVKDLQWAGNDIEGAKKLLDEAGIVDKDGNGFREYKGKELHYKACCPEGWTDWQAAMEIVAAAGQKIGINIETYFPTWDVYQTVFTNGKQTEYDIFMWSGDGASATQPWSRVRQFMSSEFVGQENNWVGNFGGYSNKRADEIIAAIPKETDPAKLKALYTEAVQIYLTEVPSFALMYRPELFHAVNESVWTNYPELDDGNNIPPTNLMCGYGIAGLYNLELVE
jgi:peptide/nickel transport system substrate-binding protein